MNAKMTVEEAAEKLEAIVRSRQVQEAIGEIASRVETADRLKKASGLEGLRELDAGEVSDDSEGALGGAAVLRTLAQMCRVQK